MNVKTFLVLLFAAVAVSAAVAGEPVKVDISAGAMGRADALVYDRPCPVPSAKAKPKSSAPANGGEINRLKAKVAELEQRLLWVGPAQAPSPAPSPSTAPSPAPSASPAATENTAAEALDEEVIARADRAMASLPPDRADPGVSVRSRVLDARVEQTLQRSDRVMARSQKLLRKGGDWGHNGQFFWIRKDLVARLSGSSATPEFLCDGGGMNNPGHRCEGLACRSVKFGGLTHHQMTPDGAFWTTECPMTSTMRCNVFVQGAGDSEGGRYIPDHRERGWPGVEGHPNDSGAWFVLNP